MTEKGTLLTGAVVGGVAHKTFELRLPTVRDNIDAVDEVGGHNGVALGAAILARQLVSLGTLKPEQIDFDLVAGLHPGDYNLLDAAAKELEKKRLAVAVSPAGSASASHSAAPA
ncbi:MULTISPECIES: phage tail assembly protein [unclassified Polaromonas]|uniref:phage tail assembly protein n=1 Tax=unclassified Polaromonas TaxID=2638319 RepID=UPI0025D98CC4|nr:MULTISPECIES: phage tail assembly protein [unclassified Polaromonas]HQR97574.1 phage tail assembly protein [Polaromonas sp.]HQS40068.1 phage tail assembly protein [Polaromonas sp.]HQS85492.1 phage tail assembly protein [Polaromonas sp.]